MLKLLRSAAMAVAFGLAVGVPAASAQPAAVAPLRAAPLLDLVGQTNIPFEQFTLPNGLRVIVHTDRKAPIVAVSVWYGVGSANEPAGKTGFAHLFEHLMFNGSGNYDGEFFIPLEEIGATNYNGTTWLDRTNYFQNVPTPALELALFLEADRMGNLLPAVTQEKLDNQRAVVQNEKRQGDNQPYGLVDYAVQSNLFPKGHPYHHDTIGSMADLDAASMDDVRAWFRQFYGPNNAVIVLAGDIDARTAKPLMQKYFGAIPRGPAVPRPTAPTPVRTQPTRVEMKDTVANARLYFNWLTPSQLRQDASLTDIAVEILAGGQSSRLFNALVREEQLAIGVSGYQLPFQLNSYAQIVVDVRQGVDPAQVEARVNAIVNEFLANGPTADEVRRVATSDVAGRIRGLEQVGGFGGKAVALAQGALYANDPGFYRQQLRWIAAATPQSVANAARAHFSRGGHVVLVTPGERGAAELALAGEASKKPAVEQAATDHTPDRSKLPAVTGEAQLTFPQVERATLSNGVQVTFARRTAVPVLSISARFDAGVAADDPAKLGLQLLTLQVMREGTTSRSGRDLIEGFERLGATFSASSSQDETFFTVSALKPNLGSSLTLFSDMIRNPAFAPTELERLRTIQLGQLAQEANNPAALGRRTLNPLLYGAAHPYGKPSSFGVADGVRAITRDDLTRFHAAWIRPDRLRLFVVGDATLPEVTAALEAAFGDWKASSSVPAGVKTFAAPQPQGAGKIVVVHRPKSPQSVILAGMPLPLKGSDDPIALRIANDTFGGAFTSRINANLRETKGWSYGVGSGVSGAQQDLLFILQAPVQADRTADSILELRKEFEGYYGANPVTAAEFARVINSNVREIPGSLETAAAVRSVLEQNALLKRPDSYITDLPGRYRAMTSVQSMAAMRGVVDPAKLIWVIVGDADEVAPQLARLNMPVEVRR